MSSIVIAGDTSGTCTLQANAVAGTTTLTLPTSSGALVVGASAGISIPNPGTSANLLTSNGTAWVSQAPAAPSTPTTIASGTSNVAVVSSGGNVTIATNGSTAMTITTAQKVGIGTAPSGSYILEVNGNPNLNSVAGVYLTCGTYDVIKNPSGNIIGFGGVTASQWDTVGLYANGTQQAAATSAGLFQFNSGYGSVATAYGCRVWVNFNGTGTVAIRASGNVSSITDNGTGDYSVIFTTSLPDNNYGVAFGGMRDADSNGSLNLTALKQGVYGTGVATSYIRILAENDSGTRVDPLMYNVAIFR